MAPSAIDPDTTTDLVRTGIKHTIAETAPSIVPDGHDSGLQELDASKLIFTRNNSPKAVPEPNSPEVWTQNVYVTTVT